MLTYRSLIKFIVIFHLTFTVIARIGSGRDGTILPIPPNCGLNNPIGENTTDLRSRIGEFPWTAVFVYHRGRAAAPICGGALINHRYILTSANCAKSVPTCKRLSRRIYLGIHDISDFEQDISMIEVVPEKTIVFQRYEDAPLSRYDDNIALIRLNSDVHFTESIRPICLPSSISNFLHSVNGDTNVVAGWGDIRLNEFAKLDKQIKLVLPVVGRDICADIYKNVHRISARLICAGNGVPDACGDFSGYPLMKNIKGNWFIEGINSFGFQCGLKNYPRTYLNVSDYDWWIRTNMEP